MHHSPPRLIRKRRVRMEAAINTLVANFYSHAEQEGCQKTLNKNEFKALLKKELPSYNKLDVDKKMNELDTNKDNKLTFEEFWAFIGQLALIQNQCRK
ncbi:protein S100-A6-like [Heptranchias perlo]|uniref:protein S100-A6-like n=1 Tax=Heptranchias perlo TaxID=212740 RepID=UPI00355A577F